MTCSSGRPGPRIQNDARAVRQCRSQVSTLRLLLTPRILAAVVHSSDGVRNAFGFSSRPPAAVMRAGIGAGMPPERARHSARGRRWQVRCSGSAGAANHRSESLRGGRGVQFVHHVDGNRTDGCEVHAVYQHAACIVPSYRRLRLAHDQHNRRVHLDRYLRRVVDRS
jgi:hypothetical protein